MARPPAPPAPPMMIGLRCISSAKFTASRMSLARSAGKMTGIWPLERRQQRRRARRRARGGEATCPSRTPPAPCRMPRRRAASSRSESICSLARRDSRRRAALLQRARRARIRDRRSRSAAARSTSATRGIDGHLRRRVAGEIHQRGLPGDDAAGRTRHDRRDADDARHADVRAVRIDAVERLRVRVERADFRRCRPSRRRPGRSPRGRRSIRSRSCPG